MRPLILATFLLALGEPTVQLWMQQAFYPVLVLVLIMASLGVPIPEDVPLIAAGVILRAHPGVASWQGTLAVALVGVMIGDVILYRLGQRWGPDVFSHRSVRWLITPERLERTSARFRRYGTWMCFFGRFVMGIRAAMCLTAGVTRFPFWRFFVADFCGAIVSIPILVWLGYWGAGMIPTLESYVAGIKWAVLGLAVLGAGGIVLHELRKHRTAPGPDPRAEPTPPQAALESRFVATPSEPRPASPSSAPAATPPAQVEQRPRDGIPAPPLAVESDAEAGTDWR